MDDFVHQIVDDWREASLSDAMRDLLSYAEKITEAPASCAEADISKLRESGWGDREIHDAVQVVSYFNYINRVADALGVDPEEGLPRWGFDES